MKLMLTTVALSAVLLFAGSTIAADHHVETVLEGLDNPCGVTIQPETGHVFVADSGAGKIVRIVDGKAQDVVTDFPIDVYGKGPKYNIGPLGLGFINKDTLVVGGGGLKDGEELLRVYKVPEAGKPAIKADAMVFNEKLAATDEIKGEGNFYALAITANAIYVTCNGDDTKGWVSKAEIKDGKVSNYKRYLATKEATEVDAPVAIAIEPTAGHIAVGQMGEITVPEDGLLTFYRATNGEKLGNYETGLSDITSIAYSPEGQMYALDFAWHDTKKGGLFHLISTEKDGEFGVKADEKLKLDKPTSMVFDKDGNLYITLIGTAEGDKKGGKLLKIAADWIKVKK